MPLGPLPYDSKKQLAENTQTVEGNRINSEIHELRSGDFGVIVEVEKNDIIAKAVRSAGFSNDKLEVWKNIVSTRYKADTRRDELEQEAKQFITEN